MVLSSVSLRLALPTWSLELDYAFSIWKPGPAKWCQIKRKVAFAGLWWAGLFPQVGAVLWRPGKLTVSWSFETQVKPIGFLDDNDQLAHEAAGQPQKGFVRNRL